MLEFVDAQFRIQWDTFTIADEFDVKFNINTSVVNVTNEMLDLILSYRSWSGIRTVNPNTGEYEIGYGIGDPDDVQGYTEPQAYAEFVGYARNRQKNLRAQLPIFALPRGAFNALFSLYLDTGTWRTVESDEGTYDLANAVKQSNWLLAADIISRGRINPELRRKEARVMQLGDFNTTKSRRQQTIQGVQKLRTLYLNGLPTEFDKKQAEFVYYRQLGSFLPGMSNLRQRRVIAQAAT